MRGVHDNGTHTHTHTHIHTHTHTRTHTVCVCVRVEKYPRWRYTHRKWGDEGGEGGETQMFREGGTKWNVICGGRGREAEEAGGWRLEVPRREGMCAGHSIKVHCVSM